jgi:hypothetical protein
MTRSPTNIHDSHPYPCKFPGKAIRPYLRTGTVVLDPFCGSGTTLLEAAKIGCSTIGFDCNPVAVLISKFKLLKGDARFVRQALDLLSDFEVASSQIVMSDARLHSFPGRDHWFGEVAQRELAGILLWIKRQVNEWSDLAVWLTTAVSSIINRVSYQDSETRYARVQRHIPPGYVVSLFLAKARRLLNALIARGELQGGATHRVEVLDVRQGLPLEEDSVDTIVTSPPYANTMDYYLYHKQRMNVLGFDFRAAQAAEIGSRWEFSSLKAKKEKWEADYRSSLAELNRVLKVGGDCVIIIGDSQIAGELIDAARLTTKLGADLGLVAEVVETIPLANRSRSFNRSFQRPNKNEHLIVMRKGVKESRKRGVGVA